MNFLKTIVHCRNEVCPLPYAFLIGGIGLPLKKPSVSRDTIATVCASIFSQTGQKVEPTLIFGDLEKMLFGWMNN
jgi:hypothetical protein